MSGKPSQAIKTIHLTAPERRELTKLLNARALDGSTSSKRVNLRVDYPAEQLTVTIVHPNKTTCTYLILPRNLSTKGIAFLLGMFVYFDSRCRVDLVTLDGRTVSRIGRVLNCRHVQRQIHEVNVVFDEPVDLREFVRLEEEAAQKSLQEFEALVQAGRTTTASGAPQLNRRVLVTDDHEADRRLINLWMRRLGLTTVDASNTVEALDRLGSERFDLIVLDMQLGGESGLDLGRKIREIHPDVPILFISADDNAQVRRQATDAGGNAFLPKPLDTNRLREVLRGLMDGPPGNTAATPVAEEPIRSTLRGDHDMIPLIEQFVGQMSGHIAQLQKACADNDQQTLRTICHQLKGAGGGYGFDAVTYSAKAVLNALAQPQQTDLTAIKAQVDELINIVRRIVTN